MNLNMPDKKYWILLILLATIATIPRALEVFNPYNYFFEPDQGHEYLATKSIVVDHQIVLVAPQGGNPEGGLGGFFKGPGFNYLLAIPFILTNGDPFGARIFMLTISVLTVIIGFILTNQILGLRTASLISFLLAVSPNLKDYAGSAWPPFVIPILMVLFIYCLYKVSHGQFRFILLLAFIIGLMMHFEMATAGVLMLLFFLSLLICLLTRTLPYRYCILSLLLIAITISPLIIYDIQHDFYNAKGIMNLIAQTKSPIDAHSTFSFFDLIKSRFNVLGWNFISTFSPNLIIWLSILAIMLVGLIMIFKDRKIIHKKKLFIFSLGFVPFFTFIVIMLYPGQIVPQWWLISLVVIYCFLLGIILDYFWTTTKLKPLTIVLLIVLTLAFLNRAIFKFRTQFVYSPHTYIKETEPINYIFKDAEGKPFGILMLARRPLEIDNYNYLIWWIGHTKYNYQPYREKKGLYYIIIEPNASIALNDKESLNKLRSGKLIKTKMMSNGFVVEKRLAGEL